MIKLIATDMDGSLLDDKGRLPEDFFSVFEQLKEKGITFAAASGRQYFSLTKYFHTIDSEILYIAENGTYVVQSGKELFSAALPHEEVQKLIAIFREIDGIEPVMCGKKNAYIENEYAPFMTQVNKFYAKFHSCGDLLKVEDEVLKFSVCSPAGEAEKFYKIIQSKCSNKLQVVLSGKYWVDIMADTATKGTALKLVQERLGITSTETMAFGDYFNDVEMLQNAYHSYAMENAPEGVKKHARFRAKSNNENGVIEVIKENVLI